MKSEDDLKVMLREHKWLKDHPQFEERPASIIEFLGERYLNIEDKIRPGLRAMLVDIFGKTTGGDKASQYEEAMMTGAIGIGKTTFSSIALPYMAHWVLCLRDPQDYFNLLPGSRIAFVQMSTSEKQVLEVVFGDIIARIDYADWFSKYPRDRKISKLIKFPKDIWILPGDSSDTTFEGYNILGAIIDEMDSHKVTTEKDYAEMGFDTIQSRISSRFVDPKTQGHKGLLICIGQMKKTGGFAYRKYTEMLNNPRACVVRMTIWESLGWSKFLDEKGKRASFWYDPKRREILPASVIDVLETTSHLIEVPLAYKSSFVSNPQKALKDLAGIPPTVEDPFISLVDRVESAVTRWIEHHQGSDSPVTQETNRSKFKEWFRSNGDPRKRVVHLDIATSGDGDAAGIAMGHVDRMIEVEGERKPYIVIDFVMRLKAPGGSQIEIAVLRRIIYQLKDDFGFRIKKITMDGFQSTDTMQQLRKRRFEVDYLSVDKSTQPYEDLRDAIYEERIEWPPYLTFVHHGDLKAVQIVNQELLELQDNGKKIDHPPKGSKDCTDAVAGVVTELMGDRTYHKGLVSKRSTETSGDVYDPFNPVVIARQQESARRQSLDALSRPPLIGGFLGVVASPFDMPSVPGRLRRGR